MNRLGNEWIPKRVMRHPAKEVGKEVIHNEEFSSPNIHINVNNKESINNK